jgi:predicted ABC-type transport system involved in lysophospholipase L1 biosynthesis ATPase subunit
VEDLLLHMNRSRGTALVIVTNNPALASRLGRTVTLVEGKL